MHFLLSKGTYKWDSVYSLNILCFCTPVCPSMIHSQANPGFRGKDCPPPFFFFLARTSPWRLSGFRGKTHGYSVALGQHIWSLPSDDSPSGQRLWAKDHGSNLSWQFLLPPDPFSKTCGLHPWPCIYLWQTRIVQVWSVRQLKVEGAGKEEIHRASSWEMIEGLHDVKVIDTPGIKFWLHHITALSKFSNFSEP